MKKVIRGSIISASNVGRKIDEFFNENGDYPSFMIMSGSTLELLKLDDVIKHTSGCHEFHGIPVAVYDGMRIGEYDLV